LVRGWRLLGVLHTKVRVFTKVVKLFFSYVQS
jgi:hypothetical protein